MGLLGAICGAVCGFVGACVGAIASAAVSVVSAFVAGYEVVKVVLAVAKELGIIRPEEEKLEEIGDKRIQAEEAGCKPENYKSYDDYKKAFEEFKPDPERSKEIPIEDKLKKGLDELYARACNEKGEIGKNVFENMLGVLQGNNSTLVPLYADLAKLISNKPGEMQDIFTYLNKGSMERTKLSATADTLAELIKANDPSLSDWDAKGKALDLRK